MPARKIGRRVIGVVIFCLVTGVTARAGEEKGVTAEGTGWGRVSKVIEVGSPDGQIRFVFRFTDGLPEYSVFYKGVGLVDRSPLGLTFLGEGNAGEAGGAEKGFERGLVPRRPVFRDGEDNYELVVGKTKAVHDRYREVEIPLVERGGRHGGPEGDETRVPEAIPGERVTIARRKGDEWFVGTINNSVEKQVYLSLNWLPPGSYTARIYSDAPDAGTAPDHLRVETRAVSAGDSLMIRLAPGGGQVMRLTKN